MVRVLNNSTLSGLTYDVIEGRVQFVLQSDCMCFLFSH